MAKIREEHVTHVIRMNECEIKAINEKLDDLVNFINVIPGFISTKEYDEYLNDIENIRQMLEDGEKEVSYTEWDPDDNPIPF